MRVLVLMGNVLSLTVTAVLQLRTFKPSTCSNHSAAILDTPRPAASVLDCARVCDAEYDNCFSITFNSDTGACTPRSKVTYDPSNPRPAEEIFYYTEICNTSLGFQLYVYRSVVQCFFISPDTAVFTAARAVCTVRNSTLIMVKSKDKLELLRHLVATVTRAMTVVGLTDAEVEGEYVWEDKQPAKDVAFAVPWKDRPDNYLNEDCAEIGLRNKHFLNDIDCDELFRFICEKDIAP